jgi:peptidoglycan hydrolase CwlO-like protein
VTEQPGEGVALPANVVIQALEEQCQSLTSQVVMQRAMILDQQRQLTEAQAKLAALDGAGEMPGS